MKKVKLFGLVAMAALALVACKKTNNDVVDPSEDSAIGWMSISLNTPSTNSNGGMQAPTRAAMADNDQFNDGLSYEYRVREAILVLFDQAGTSEADYTFHAAYKIPVNPKLQQPVNDQITSRASSAVKVTTVANGMHALVIANPNLVATVGEKNSLTVGSLVFKADDATKKTYSDLQNAIVTYTQAADWKNPLTYKGEEVAITMVNAPLVDKQGGAVSPAGANVLTLAPVNTAALYSTEAEALAATTPTCEIFLERTVAKVTLADKSSHKLVVPAVGGGDPIEHNFTITGWVLDNTNKSSYLVHRLANADVNVKNYFAYESGKSDITNPFRFVGHVPVGQDAGGHSYYRLYWSIDPNYSTVGSFNTNTGFPFLEINENRPQYCFENTFDVAHQTWQNTTRVVIRAEFNGGTSFYTINNDDSHIYTTGATGTLIQHMAGQLLTAIDNMIHVQNRLQLKAGVTLNATTVSDYFDYTIEPEKAEVNDNAFKITFKLTPLAISEEIFVNYNHGDGTAEQTACRGALDEVFADVREANPHIQRYDNGVVYYQARIKHFGDELTPWNTWETTHKPSTSVIYPGADNTEIESNYLGRYGMVRNNWYALELNSIKHFGTPYIPEVTGDDTPDDELDSYLSIRINILSWAKRTQGLDF